VFEEKAFGNEQLGRRLPVHECRVLGGHVHQVKNESYCISQRMNAEHPDELRRDLRGDNIFRRIFVYLSNIAGRARARVRSGGRSESEAPQKSNG